MRTQQEYDRRRDQSANSPQPDGFGSSGQAWPAQGQIVMGPSFYVWDESPKQAREWGVELANAWLAHRR
jgi:hypothetical protein